jgi:hypothetical protein
MRKRAGLLLVLCCSITAVGVAQDLVPVRIHGSDGYIDELGHVRIEPQYESAWPFSEGIAMVQSRGSWIYINEDGQPISTDRYDFDSGSLPVDNPFFKESRAIVTVGLKYGVIDATGRMVVPPKYDVLYAYREGLAKFIVFDGWKQGFIDVNGNVVIPPVFDSISWNRLDQGFSEGLVPFGDGGKFGFMDTSGTIRIPALYEDVGSFSGGYVAAKRQGKWGILDALGNTQINFVYDGIQPFGDGMFAAHKGSESFVLDRKGQRVPTPPIQMLWPEGGFLIYESGDKFGFMDYSLKVLTAPISKRLSAVSNGFAVVEKSGVFGLIDRTGKLVLPYKYDSIQIASPRMFLVRSPGFSGYVDPSGRVVFQED